MFPRRRVPENGPLKAAVIGAGVFGHHHATKYKALGQASGDVELFAVADPNADMRAKAMPGEDPMSLPHPDEVASQMIAMCEPTFNDNGGVWKYDSKGLFKQF